MNQRDDKINRATARFAATWATFCGDTPGADLLTDGLLIRRWADNRFPFWNIAIVPGAVATAPELRASLAAGTTFARTKRQSGSIWVADERLALFGGERAGVVAEVGLVEGSTMTEMIGSIPAMTLREPSTLVFERVGDEVALAALADINADAYGLEATTARAGIATAPEPG